MYATLRHKDHEVHTKITKRGCWWSSCSLWPSCRSVGASSRGQTRRDVRDAPTQRPRSAHKDHKEGLLVVFVFFVAFVPERRRVKPWPDPARCTRRSDTKTTKCTERSQRRVVGGLRVLCGLRAGA